MFTSLRYAAFLVLLGASTVRTSPTPADRELAPRSYPSGPNNEFTCYYECPGGGNAVRGTNSATCTVNGETCTYDSSSGARTSGSEANCGTKANGPVCRPKDETPDNNQFKRSGPMRHKRKLTKSERAIKKRQFDPKKIRSMSKQRKSFPPRD